MGLVGSLQPAVHELQLLNEHDGLKQKDLGRRAISWRLPKSERYHPPLGERLLPLSALDGPRRKHQRGRLRKEELIKGSKVEIKYLGWAFCPTHQNNPPKNLATLTIVSR